MATTGLFHVYEYVQRAIKVDRSSWINSMLCDNEVSSSTGTAVW